MKANLQALENAYWAWHRPPNTGDKYFDFNVMAKEVYGLNLVYTFNSTGYRVLTDAIVEDEKKYAVFLLRWL